MLTRRKFLALLGGGVVVAGGAAAGVRALPDGGPSDGPPTVRVGGEPCADCGMTLGDPRYVAAWRTGDRAEARFDDIGCMVNHLRGRVLSAPRFWVRDHADPERWLEAGAASYVVTPRLKTPMAYGVGAFSTVEAARAFLGAPDGRIWTWSELQASLPSRN